MLEKVKKQKKLISDMILNIFAAGFPIIVLQLIIYPDLSTTLAEATYGFMLTIYSFWVVVSNSLGNVLNNIRLLNHNEYQKKGLTGDFNYLLIRYSVLNLVVIFILTIVYSGKMDWPEIILSLVISSLLLWKAYLVVGFRLVLSYKNILMDSIFQTVGFVLGWLLVKRTGLWQMVYLVGYLFSVLYLYVKTDLKKETICRTELFQKMKHDSDIYAVATFSAGGINYIDKLLLYPLMGGEVVSIYYTATILGKIISMVSGPITGVMLSYIAKWEQGKRSVFTKILGIAVGISVAGYFVTLAISRGVIGLLFPQWVERVMIYLPVTTVAVLIQALNSFLHPFILKFYNIRWQVAINVSSILVYIVSAVMLWNAFGLMGFCFGTIIGNLAKTIIMISIHVAKSANDRPQRRRA